MLPLGVGVTQRSFGEIVSTETERPPKKNSSGSGNSKGELSQVQAKRNDLLK